MGIFKVTLDDPFEEIPSCVWPECSTGTTMPLFWYISENPCRVVLVESAEGVLQHALILIYTYLFWKYVNRCQFIGCVKHLYERFSGIAA